MKYQGLAIVGPSCSGKTDAAIAVAKRHNGALIACDTIQIFRGFEIGSGAPTPQELGTVPAFLYGERKPEYGMLYPKAYTKIAANASLAAKFGGYMPILEGCSDSFVTELRRNSLFSQFGFFVLLPNQNSLRERIVARLNQLIEGGLEEEVRRLLAEGKGKTAPMKASITHRHFLPYVLGQITFSEAYELTLEAWMQSIARHITVFDSLPNKHKIQVDSPEKTLERLEELIM